MTAALRVRDAGFVSANDHLVLPPDTFTKRLPAKYRERGPRVVPVGSRPGHGVLEDFLSEKGLSAALEQTRRTTGSDDQPGDAWSFDGRLYPTAASSLVDDVEAMGPQSLLPFSYRDVAGRFIDPVARLEAMDRDGIAVSVCFPMVEFPSYCGHLFLGSSDRELAHLCVRAYNDHVIDDWAGAAARRFVPVACLPLWDTTLAAGEVRRVAAKGAKAITFPDDPFRLGLSSLHESDLPWDPVFDAAQETGLPLCIHVGASWWLPPAPKTQPATVALAMAGSLPSLTFFDWILSGVFLRFPRLKLVLSEGKIGWIPFALEHADYVWHRHRRIWGSPLPDPPSSYFAEHVFGCFLPFERFGTRRIREIGVDNCLLETDYPHPDTSFPDTRKLVSDTLGHLDDFEFERVTRGNALRVFGFESPDEPLPVEPEGRR